MSPFGLQLKCRRLACGMSQQALAAAFRVSPRVISAYETGKTRPPRGARLAELGKILGLSGDELRQFRSAAETSSYRPTIPATSRPKEVQLVNLLIQSLGRLDRDQFDRLYAVINGERR